MTTTATDLYACPDPGCLIFPYDRQSDLDEHVASGQHVYAGSWATPVVAPSDRAANGDHESDGEGCGRSRQTPDPSIVTWTKHGDGWALRGVNLKSGSTVEVTKRDGSTQQVRVGRIVEGATKDGFDVALPATDEHPHWAKRGDAWVVAVPGGGEPGVTVTIHKRDGSTVDAVLGAVVDKVDGCTFHDANPAEMATRAESGQSVTAGVEAIAGHVYKTTDGDIVRVQESRAGHLYGKMWNGSGWEYCAGCIRTLDHELTADEAAEFGHATAHCVFCTRALEDDRSVKMGYGPRCAEKHSLPYGHR